MVGVWEYNEFVKGTITYPDGKKYEGQFRYRERNGRGTLTYADGRKYVGEYKDDVPHGFGTGFSADGAAEYRGEWANGEPLHGPSQVD